MNIRIEVLPFLAASALAGAGISVLCLLLRARLRRALAAGLVPAAVLTGFFLYFFRDPPRYAPADPEAVVAGADGRVVGIAHMTNGEFTWLALRSGLSEKDLARMGRLAADEVVRISIFLSLLDVHVNRAPMSGQSEFLGYFPGKRFFTFQEKSSAENQHNAILFTNERTSCLVNQIVGPVCRRVVYWLPKDRPAGLKAGDRIGMMKFGSRLDMYFPAGDVRIVAGAGDRVRAGETVIARMLASAEDPGGEG